MWRWMFFLTLLVACASNETKKTNNINFYHWKTNTNLSKAEKEVLDSLKTKTIYFRFFDVDVNERNEIFPISVIREIDSSFKNYNIIPTIYITNNTFKQVNHIDSLVNQVKGLINQMYNHHFGGKPKSIQIDCDWTTSTQTNYFSFLDKLNSLYQVSATIRLHQIKYKAKTGVPPCAYGSLMLYNMGDIKDSSKNSIFSMDIIKNYLNSNTSYPLNLSLALPVYKWGIVTLPDERIKIINDLSKANLNANNITFVSKSTFKIDSAIFLKKQYLPKNTKIKLEEVKMEDLKEALDYIKQIKGLKWKEIILYHLQESILNDYKVSNLKTFTLN